MGDSYATGTTSDRKPTQTGKHGYWENPAINKRINGQEFGLKPKDMVGIPWLVAFALRADGWYLRSDIIWSKVNPMPESVTDRPTKAHEYIFLLSKSPTYYYDAEAIKERVSNGAHRRKANGANSRMVLERAAGRENSKPNPSRSNIPGVGPKAADEGSGIRYNVGFSAAVTDLVSDRNKRSVWTVATAPYKEAHFATFPPDLIKPCILAGTSARGCCPGCGAGWERILEKPAVGKFDYNGKHSADKSSAGRNILAGAARLAGGEHDNPFPPKKTIGWRPTCNCSDPPWPKPVPCTVLDPFGGSGTTGQVALELGRKAILIELNPEYIGLIRQRCTLTPGLALA